MARGEMGEGGGERIVGLVVASEHNTLRNVLCHVLCSASGA